MTRDPISKLALVIDAKRKLVERDSFVMLVELVDDYIAARDARHAASRERRETLEANRRAGNFKKMDLDSLAFLKTAYDVEHKALAKLRAVVRDDKEQR